MAKANIEAFARKGEKNILKNMFGGSDSDSDDSSHNESDDERPIKCKTAATAATDQTPAAGGEDTESPSVYRSIYETFEVLLRQQKQKGIAHQLWPAATFLSHYLEQNTAILCGHPASSSSGSKDVISLQSGSGDTVSPENVSIIELGAGIGLCGLVCHQLKFKKVILTDLPVALPLLNENIALNSAESVPGSLTAMVLSWGVKDELDAVMKSFPPDDRIVCIAADCVYWEVLFVPLFETLKSLVLDYHVDVVIAHVKRWKKDEKFFKMCRKVMRVEVLLERLDMVPHEHTGVPTREMKRIYRISAP